MKRTLGEQLFEAYLSGRGVGWRYEEPQSGGTSRPDYLVLVDPQVLVEVKDIEENAFDRAFRKLGAGFLGTSSYDRIRTKLDKAKAKFKDHRDRGLACVLILHNSGSFAHLSNENLAGAMHGNLGFSIQIGDVEIVPRPRFDQRTARLRENLNTTISAVAVVERFSPNDQLLRSEVDKRVGSPYGRSTEEVVRQVVEALKAVREENPAVDFDLEVPRVRVVHNPHARVPLRADVFSGEHDGQFLANLALLSDR